jgi:hypothetical protein
VLARRTLPLMERAGDLWGQEILTDYLVHLHNWSRDFAAVRRIVARLEARDAGSPGRASRPSCRWCAVTAPCSRMPRAITGSRSTRWRRASTPPPGVAARAPGRARGAACACSWRGSRAQASRHVEAIRAAGTTRPRLPARDVRPARALPPGPPGRDGRAGRAGLLASLREARPASVQPRGRGGRRDQQPPAQRAKCQAVGRRAYEIAATALLERPSRWTASSDHARRPPRTTSASSSTCGRARSGRGRSSRPPGCTRRPARGRVLFRCSTARAARACVCAWCNACTRRRHVAVRAAVPPAERGPLR